MAAPTGNVEEEERFCTVECTVATGFEQTAKEEVKEKLKCDAKSSRGKITITGPISLVPRILKLGTIDHCRVVLKRIQGFEFPKDEALSLQKARDLVKDVDWEHGIAVWNQVFSVEHPIDASHESASGKVGTVDLNDKYTLPPKQSSAKEKKAKKRGGRNKNQRREKDKENQGKQQKSKEELEKPSKTQGDGADIPASEKDTNYEESPLKSDTNCESETSPTKLDSECENASPTKDITEDTTTLTQDESQVKNQAGALDDEDDTPESDRQAGMLPESEKQDTTELPDASASDVIPEDEKKEKDNNVQSEDAEEQSPVKAQSEAAEPSPVKACPDATKPKFRVTCHRVGENHKFNSKDMAANFGGGIVNYFGWTVDLTQFDIEVLLNIDWDEVSVCFSLTKESLHRRLLTNFGMTTLRPTIAYNMLRLCEIQCGDVVCDPMCGTGSIPISASVSWPKAIHLCGEIYGKAIEKTYENLINLNIKKKTNKRRLVDLDIYQWDATNLPLRDGSVDVFITDLPFGRRFSNKYSNNKLYPLILNELARVTRKNTGRACFITEDKKCMVKLIQESFLWQRRKFLSVNLGGLDTGVYLLHRTNEDIAPKEPEESPEEIARKSKERSTAQAESRKKYLEDLKKMTSGGPKLPNKKEVNKSKESESQTQTSAKRPTAEGSAQVSETNGSLLETSSQTNESGSPRKRQKTESSDSEAQTTGQVENKDLSVSEDSFPSIVETRSQTTETISSKADIGSQVVSNTSVTTESGIQAESDFSSPVKVKTRSQSSGTSPNITNTRSQATDMSKLTAETGSQVSTTRNISTDTGLEPTQKNSIGTSSRTSSIDSGVQAIESTAEKVDFGFQAGLGTDPETRPGHTSESKEDVNNKLNVTDNAQTMQQPESSKESHVLSENQKTTTDDIPAQNTPSIKSTCQPVSEASTDSKKDDLETIQSKKSSTVKETAESNQTIPSTNNKVESKDVLKALGSDLSTEGATNEGATIIAGDKRPNQFMDKNLEGVITLENKLLDNSLNDSKNDSFVHIKIPEYATCVDTGTSKVASDLSQSDKDSEDVKSGEEVQSGEKVKSGEDVKSDEEKKDCQLL